MRPLGCTSMSEPTEKRDGQETWDWGDNRVDTRQRLRFDPLANSNESANLLLVSPGFKRTI